LQHLQSQEECSVKSRSDFESLHASSACLDIPLPHDRLQQQQQQQEADEAQHLFDLAGEESTDSYTNATPASGRRPNSSTLNSEISSPLDARTPHLPIPPLLNLPTLNQIDAQTAWDLQMCLDSKQNNNFRSIMSPPAAFPASTTLAMRPSGMVFFSLSTSPSPPFSSFEHRVTTRKTP